MKTIAKIALIAITVSSVSFVGCKKGENDPFLSLKSRKARLHGEWVVVSGSGTSTNTIGSITSTTTMVYDGTTETQTTGSSTQTDKWTQTYEFEKDGAFTSVYTDNDASPAQVTTTTGTWNWTGGVGEAKNKSAIILYTESITQGSASATYTGEDRPTSIMEIDQLKSKEIIFHGMASSTTSGSGSTDDYTWTLEPK
jgi:hypothetical protein